jgi:hypothetical protein
MTVIKVRKTPTSAFNPDRPASALLLAQIEHLEHAAGLPEKKQIRRSEGNAARYIAELTAKILGTAPPAAPPPSRSKKRSKPSKKTSTKRSKKKAGKKPKKTAKRRAR